MKIFKYQFWHLLSLVILLSTLFYFVNKDEIETLYGGIWYVETYNWLLFAIAAPIVHQIYVLICWRSELYYQSISKLFGKKAGFILYKIGFAILIFLRLVTIVILAISNEGTLYINPYLSYGLAALFAIPVIYLFYSVKKYFGMDRAFGIDHFEPEKSKDLPMVKKGIFKYTSNGMYEYGFLILWIPALLFLSKAALLVALFQHIYIWVHYYFTELPDMKFIYGKKK